MELVSPDFETNVDTERLSPITRHLISELSLMPGRYFGDLSDLSSNLVVFTLAEAPACVQ